MHTTKTPMTAMASILSVLALVSFSAASFAHEARIRIAQGETTIDFKIDAPRLSRALIQLTEQSGLQLIYPAGDKIIDLPARPLAGKYTTEAALRQLLQGTGLKYEFLDAKTISIVDPGAKRSLVKTSARGENAAVKLVQAGERRMAKAEPPVEGRPEAPVTRDDSSDSKGIPEILVRGARGASADIRRSNDDVQPYVVFDAEEIERSMAASLDDFLRVRVPMNQSRRRFDQAGTLNAQGNRSQIDLRGLGAEETLVLVNGRRMPGVAEQSGGTSQADINGIPLSAIERIEILPSTAGGIYGGGATGGVVNIVLKRDYTSMAVTARYDGTFDGGGAERRLDATAGFSLGGTEIMLMASSRDGNPLYVGDRDFARRARELHRRNNNNNFLTAANPVFGYTTNIKSVNNTPLVLKDGTALGSTVAHVAVGSAGYATDGAFAFRPGYNLDLADATFGNADSLLTVPTVRSVQVNLRRDFTARISAFLDAGRFENRSLRMGSAGLPSSQAIITLPALVGGAPNPANPFMQAVRLAVPMVGFDTDRLVTPSDSLSEKIGAGVSVHLAGDWMAQVEYSLGFSDYNFSYGQRALTPDGLAALGNGTLDPLRDVNLFPFDFSPYYAQGASAQSVKVTFPAEQKNGTLRVSGSLLHLPGGPLRLSALLDHREEYTGDRVGAYYVADVLDYYYYADAGSTTKSAYAELTAPLFTHANSRPGIRTLELLASYRHDDTATRTRPALAGTVSIPSADGPFPDLPYETRSVTADQYTLGFRYEPVESLALRMSYGKGVLPPSPAQLSVVDMLALGSPPSPTLIDEKRGGTLIDTSGIVAYTAAGRLNLRPELSESLSVGLILTPPVLAGLRVSLDYTRIQKKDEIGLLSAQSLMNDEDLFPGAVVRNALTPADAALGYTGGTIRELHTGAVNIAEMRVEAFDLQATYHWNTRFGSFAANMIGALQPIRTQRETPTSVEHNPVGYSNGPLKLRLNTGLRWTLGDLDVGWDMQYYDAYRVYSDDASVTTRNNSILSQGSPMVPTQTYHDVYGRYRCGETGFAGGLLKNTELLLSVQNVLGTLPPTLASLSPTGLGSVYATEGNPRLRRYSISITKNFN